MPAHATTAAAKQSRRSVLGPKHRVHVRRPRRRLVHALRVFLPLLALCLLGAAVLWPRLGGGIEQLSRFLPVEIEEVPGDYGIYRLTMRGFDRSGHPYVFTAETAAKFDAGIEAMDLRVPTADIAFGDGSWVAVMGEDGIYRPDDDVLYLENSVNVFHDAGYEINARNVTLNLESGAAYSGEPVFGHGEFGTLDGSGLEILDEGGRIRITGPAKVVVYPDAGTQ